MSRIGAQPINIPDGVTVAVEGDVVTVTGPKGKLAHSVPEGIVVEEKEGVVRLRPSTEARELKALWGTNRAVLYNMVRGVHEGFEKRLEVHGVGYRARVDGNTLELSVGFSHPVKIAAPEGISFSVDKNTITVSGVNKVLVGETAAAVRKVRRPEPYKGKGIRYEGEHVRRKAGKKAVAGE